MKIQVFLKKNSENFSNPDTQPVKFSLVEDKDLLKKLESEIEKGDYLTLYRSVQVAPDGTLHSPMAGKIKGQWGPQIFLDKWEQADERPDLAIPRIDKKTGKHKKYGKIQDEGYGNPAYDFKLNKGRKSIEAAYNPYIHSSTTPLNDQFKEAYQRPELVTIEVLVPKSELTSGYHAEKAKNSVGMKDWNPGVVQKKLSGTRQVMLSRWDKPVRIVPDAEVAQHIKKMLNGKNIAIPANVVAPSLRSKLEKIGVKIDYSVKEYVAEKDVTERPDIKLSVIEQGKRPYYDIPFAESVDAVMNDTYTGDGSVFMCYTPRFFLDIGFSRLPIMTTAKHIKSIYSPQETTGDHNHDLGDVIKQIPEKLEKPLMVITSKTRPNTSVVVILELEDKNNDTVVVPILIDGISQRGKINAHIMTSAQGRSNAFTELVRNAIDKENSGKPSIIYAQKKAESVANAEGVQFPNGFAFDSVNHNIADVGIYEADQSLSDPKIIPWDERETVGSDDKLMQIIEKIKSDSENSSKIVDENGEPLVVYHGSKWNPLLEKIEKAVFDAKRVKNGVGIFYFDKEKAKRYPAYSNKIRKIPIGFLHNIADVGIKVKPQTKTFQFKKWFGDSKVVDENGEPLVVYHGSKWNPLLEKIEKAVFDAKRVKNGVGIFYFDKEKAKRYPAYSNKIRKIPIGFLHNIADVGIKVKPQIETLEVIKMIQRMKKALQAWQARRAALKAEQKMIAARWEYWVSTGVVKLQKKHQNSK